MSLSQPGLTITSPVAGSQLYIRLSGGIRSSVVVVAEPIVDGELGAYLEIVLSVNAPIADVLVTIWQGIGTRARLRNAEQEIGVCISCHRSVEVKRAIIIDEAIARSIALEDKAELPYVAACLPIGRVQGGNVCIVELHPARNVGDLLQSADGNRRKPLTGRIAWVGTL